MKPVEIKSTDAAVMALEAKLLGGARAVEVPIVRGVRDSLQTIPIVLPKKTKKGHGFYEVPTLHGNFRADGG